MSKRTLFLLLYINLGVGGLILADAFIFPSRNLPKVCEGKWSIIRPYNTIQKNYFFISLDGISYGVNGDLYYNVKIGDSIRLIRSLLLAAKLTLEYKADGKARKCDINFINNSGAPFLIFDATITLLLLIFFEKVPYKPGRRHLTIVLLIMTAGLIVFYLLGSRFLM